MRKIAFLFGLALILVVTACTQQETNTVVEVAEPKKGNMYEASELAIIMREIRDDFQTQRVNLQNGGKLDEELINKYKAMLTAKPTSTKDTVGPFHGFANAFLAQLEKVNSSEDPVATFNMAVETCVSCHKEYCQGPIPTIQKLTIAR